MSVSRPTTDRTRRLLRTLELLEQHSILDTRATGEKLQVPIALRGIRHAPDCGHDGRHELLASCERAGVVALGEGVDEVLDDGLRVVGGAAPGLRVVAHDL